ncbi:out at first protein [Maniola jurtina]|uniref:out at first protein n=1 Tax=Maniola jurtina TaxID=191418 RepID=UPI001E685CA7|nr:out at first protein [Maniola jurtina]XP_045768894.1 out at first protein [Maniola jurtina]
MEILVLKCILLLYIVVKPTNLQLLINVKNQGGDVMQENITANISEDTVTLEFLRLDGVYVSQLVDFTNEVEAMKVVIPGEEELGQSGHQVLCFLTHAAQADFIAPDAMAKLRQKNPGTVRVAEEDKGWRQTTATAWAGRATGMLSPAAARHCASARDRVYIRSADLTRWTPRAGVEPSSFSSEVIPFPPQALTSDTAEGSPAVSVCVAETDTSKECICHLEVCVNWYPCGLKYCKGKPQGGLSYRCGIKTCHRCFRYHFYVRRRDTCLNYM